MNIDDDEFEAHVESAIDALSADPMKAEEAFLGACDDAIELVFRAYAGRDPMKIMAAMDAAIRPMLFDEAERIAEAAIDAAHYDELDAVAYDRHAFRKESI